MTLRINDLPHVVILEVLAHVPFEDLLRRCRLVCSLWRDMVDLPTLWKKKCQQAGLWLDKGIPNPKHWMYFYFLFKKKRNLIRNPCAVEGFRFWQFDHIGSGKWAIEFIHETHGQLFPDPAVKKYFVTSYSECKKSQLIDLKAAGYWDELMDEVQPDIVVTDWVSARHDCGCRYDQMVALLSKEQTVLHKYRMKPKVIRQWGNASWKRITHTLRNYGPGVRYIGFQHGGRDTQFWAGWYGVRVTNTSLVIELPSFEDDRDGL